MRVLHVISSSGMYGAEAVILSLMRQAARVDLGHRALAVFQHDPPRKPMLYDVAIERGFDPEALSLLPCRGQFDPSISGQLRALTTRFGSDVVHAHGYKADLYTAFTWARRGPRPALVSTCHTWYDNDLAVRLYGTLDRWALRRFDRVVAVSEEVQHRLLRAGVSAARTQLIRNGVEVEPAFVDGTARNADSADWEGRLHVGLVGRLAPEKGIADFLGAVSLLRDRFPRARFSVAGEGPDRRALEALRGELGLQDAVSFVGRQANMASFYASLDLLVSSSVQEGLPIALLEGMASGLPVVATRVGAVPELVVDGATGTLVPSRAPERLAAAIEHLLKSPTLRHSFGEAGRRRVFEEFSAAHMARDYAAVYQQALDVQPKAEAVRGGRVHEHGA